MAACYVASKTLRDSQSSPSGASKRAKVDVPVGRCAASVCADVKTALASEIHCVVRCAFANDQKRAVESSASLVLGKFGESVMTGHVYAFL